MLKLRIREYSPTGDKGRVLPVINGTLTVTSRLNDTPTIDFSMSTRMAGRMPADGFVVGVEYAVGNDRYQPLPQHDRFIVFTDESDDVDSAQVVRYTGQSYAVWLLAHTYLHWSASAKNGERTYGTDAARVSAGYIMRSMLIESHNRGWGSQLTYDFDGDGDSNDKVWPTGDRVKQSFRLLTPLTEVLQALNDSGLCDWTVVGNKLRLFVHDSLGQDRTNRLLGRGNITSAPMKSDMSNIFTHLTVVPEKARHWLYLPNAGAPTKYGRLEATMTQSGIESHTTATRLAQPALRGGRTVMREESFQYSPRTNDLTPWKDINIGDRISAIVHGAKLVRRVIGFVAKQQDTGTDVQVVLGDPIHTQARKLLDRVRSGSKGGIIGGSGNSFPGSNGPINPIPAKPTNLRLVSNGAGWTEDGKSLAAVAVAWDEVILGVDGSTVDLRGYDVWVRQPGKKRQYVTSVSDPEAEVILEPDGDSLISVRAQSDFGYWSEYSNELLVKPQKPAPPDPPTEPTFRTSNGAIQIIWDGNLDSGDGPYEAPVWISHCLVELKRDTDTEWERFTQDSGWVHTGLTRGDIWQARLIAVDFRGQLSEPGPHAEVTVESAVQEALEHADDAAEEAREAKEAAMAALSRGPNLYPDPSFEYGGVGLDTSLTGWEIVEDSGAYHGLHTLRITDVAGGSVPPALSYTRVSGGDAVQFEAWVKRTDENQSGNILCVYQHREGTVGKAPTTVTATAVSIDTFPVGVWTKYTGTVILPALATESRFYLHIAQAVPQDNLEGVRVDSVYVGLKADIQEALDAVADLEDTLGPQILAAQSTANTAAQEAAVAKSSALTAISGLGIVNSRVDGVEVTVNGKTRVYRSTSAPGAGNTTGSIGDIWWRYDGSLSGPVRGQWTRTAEGAGGWTETPIDSRAIANLTVDKLAVTGGATFPLAVIDTLVGDQAFFRALQSERVIVDATEMAPGPGGYEKTWELGADADIRILSNGNDYLAINPAGSTIAGRSAYGPVVNVTPGTTISVNFRATWLNGSMTTRFNVAVYWYYADGTPFTTERTIAYDSNGDWSVITRSETVVVPEGATRARVRFYSYADSEVGSTHRRAFHNLTVKPQVGAVLIENGAITGDKVNATSVAATVANVIDLKTSRLVWDNATGSNAWITNLVGDSTFMRSLYSERVIVDAADLAPGPGGYLPAWDLTNAGATTLSSNVDNSGRVLQLTVRTATSTAIGPKTSVTGANKISVKLSMRANGSPNAGINTRIYFYDASDTVISNVLVKTVTDSTTAIDEVVVVPTGARYAELRFATYTHSSPQGVWWPTNMNVRPQVGSVLIENGSITAPKIFAGSIEYEHMSGGALDAFQITSPEIQSVPQANRGIKWSGSKLSGYNNSGTETFRLDATRATITAGILRTTATTNRGVQMDGSYFRAWTSSGAETFRLTASTGAVTITGGLIKTSDEGTTVTIDPSEGGVLLRQAAGSLSRVVGEFFVSNTSYGLVFRDNATGGPSSTRGRARLEMVKKPDETGVYLRMYDADGNTRIELDDHFERGVFVNNPGNSSYSRMRSGRITVNAAGMGSDGGFWLLNGPTTTTAANAVIATTPAGRFYRSTSLRKYKKQLRSLSVDIDPLKILEVEPQTWYDAGEVAMAEQAKLEAQARAKGIMVVAPSEVTTDFKPRRISGFVAEDMEAAGLEVLCQYDSDGNLTGIAYDRVPAALVLAVRSLRDRVVSLESALAATRKEK